MRREGKSTRSETQWKRQQGPDIITQHDATWLQYKLQFSVSDGD